MRRREFIELLGGATACPLAALAQRPAVPVIGFLRAGQPPKSWVEAFQNGLRERGYVNSQNVVIVFRFTDGAVDQLPQLVEELVRLKVDVILASAAQPAVAAKKATRSVPIVFVGVFDPVELGLVSSLGLPGGNITGLAVTAGDFAGKRLERLYDRQHPSTVGSFAVPQKEPALAFAKAITQHEFGRFYWDERRRDAQERVGTNQGRAARASQAREAEEVALMFGLAARENSVPRVGSNSPSPPDHPAPERPEQE